MYLRELITGWFFCDVISARCNLPLLNPFLFGTDKANLSKKSTSVSETYVQTNLSNTMEKTVQDMIADNNAFVAKTCSSCLIPVVLMQKTMCESYAAWSERSEESQRYLRAVALTDCANAYTSICGISAPSLEKSTRLLLAHIRGNLPTVDVSYVDAIFNLPDVGTKLRTSREIWKKFVSSGEFNISFLGGRLAKQVQTKIASGDSVKICEDDRDER